MVEHTVFKIVLFHMENCGHCKAILLPKGTSIWDHIKIALKKLESSKKIIFKFIEIEANEVHQGMLKNQELSEPVKKQLVEIVSRRGYPTAFLVKPPSHKNGNETIKQYDSRITIEEFVKFVLKNVTSLKNNRATTYDGRLRSRRGGRLRSRRGSRGSRGSRRNGRRTTRKNWP
jgi:hypothetical protein